jgi:hypothetical protein
MLTDIIPFSTRINPGNVDRTSSFDEAGHP